MSSSLWCLLPVPKCLLPSDVERDSYSKKEMQLNTNNKPKLSSVVIDLAVFNTAAVLTQPQIHLSDPPDIVPVPPPPLAPPWLHHSVYLGPLESLFLTIVEIPPRYASIHNYPILGCTVISHSNLICGMCFPPPVYHPLVSFHSQLSLSLLIGFPIINILRFHSAHCMFDEMTLGCICYFSLINGSLHFKQWHSGTNKAPGSGLPITILIDRLEDKTIIETVGEWIHEPYGPFYVCLFKNWYKCPAILISHFNGKPLTIPACSRQLELLYVDEYPNYVALQYDASLLKSTLSSCKDVYLRNCPCLVLFGENSTARCFQLDQIGHFQHFKRAKSEYVSYMLVSINGGEDGLNLHPSLLLGCKDFTILYAKKKGIMDGYSVVLFKLLIGKHIHERWQQKSQESHSQFGVIVDHDECEKAVLFNIGLASKTVIIFIDLEDKIIFRGVGNDIINVGLIPYLFSNILCNKKTIGDIKVVEVEMMKRIRHKKMLLSSWSDALEFYHVQNTLEFISMEPLEVDSLNSQIFFTHYHDYCIVGSSTWWQIKAKNMLTQGIMTYDGNINHCEVKKHVAGATCHDFFKMFVICEIRPWGLIDPTINLSSKMFVMCEVRPWGLIDPTINLCKILAVIDEKPHTNNLYENVNFYMSFCFDPWHQNKLNQELMEYGACDSWSTISINNSSGTWVTYSWHKDCLVSGLHIAWVCQIVRKTSLTQRQDSLHLKYFYFKQWDPGILLLFHGIFDFRNKYFFSFLKQQVLNISWRRNK